MSRFLVATTAISHASGFNNTVKLNNGVDMPNLAFAAQVWDADTCTDATSKALQAGFQFVWSSVLIGSGCQAAQGDAIRASGMDRSKLFIAGTVNSAGCSNLDDCYTSTMSESEQQFQVLGFDTLDMLMLDYPAYSGCDAIAGQWKAFEELYAQNRVRTIAVSNFSPDQIECITSNASATVPSVNQLHYSVGDAGTMIADNAKYGIYVQSYSPLNSGSLISDDDCKAIGAKYGKSAAQVALKWIIQTNGTIATQSTSLAHLQEDVDLFDFELTEDELATLNGKSAFVV